MALTPVAGDLTVSWRRRARTNSLWRDTIDVPLDEAAEVYEVDILDDDKAAVVRTVAGTASAAGTEIENSSQTLLYKAADITSDFPGDIAASLADPERWKILSGGWKQAREATPNSGDYYRVATGDNSAAYLDVDVRRYCRLDVIDAGGVAIELSLFQGTDITAAEGLLSMAFYASNGRELASVSSSASTVTVGAWAAKTLVTTIPAFARSIRLTMTANNEGCAFDGPAVLTIDAAARTHHMKIYQIGGGNMRGLPLEVTL